MTAVITSAFYKVKLVVFAFIESHTEYKENTQNFVIEHFFKRKHKALHSSKKGCMTNCHVGTLKCPTLP